jgi:pyruvate kinase
MRPDRNVPAGINRLIEQLTAIREHMIALEKDCSCPLGAVAPAWRVSARNLLHYLSLRRHDVRGLQDRLAELGLSSLGRSEGGVLANLDAVLHVLGRLAGRETPRVTPEPLTLARGRRLLARHARALLGPPPAGRPVRVMVTIPGEAADDYPLVRDLLLAGMDCMRVNCAHDDADVWGRVIAHLRRAESEVGRRCRVHMDLAGPKIRTGPLPPGPRVAKVRPERDALGRVADAARVWLTADVSAPPPEGSVAIPVAADWLAGLRPGDRVRFRDARGARRTWAVETVSATGCLARSSKTCYVTTGTALTSEPERAGKRRRPATARAGELPALETRLELSPGDRLAIVRGDGLGSLSPPEIGCTLPEAFDAVAVGQPVWFDDGRIGGVIREVAADRFVVEVTACLPGSRLGAGKGINLPETALQLPALTPKDIEDLRFVAAHADMVGYSFAGSAEGVAELQRQLAAAGGHRLGVVLKIETRRGFEHLPELLLASMQSPAVGVMIARGDLAVECGFERLAEVQEEILWLCEAAHVPVVWATQVLETLAKTGRPSRAEVTDAGMSVRAECVMLNKGPHVVDAVRVLDDILRRMQAHTHKKRSMLRRLKVAAGFVPPRSGRPDTGDA